MVIVVSIINNSFQLTQPQYRVWYTEQINPGTPIGNITGVMRLKKRLNVEMLKNSVLLLLKNCESLRIQIKEENGQPIQYIANYEDREIDGYTFPNEQALDDWAQQKAETPFVIYNSNLVEISIFTLGDNETGFLVKMHHLISDGWTMTLIGEKILNYYNHLSTNQEIEYKSNHSYKSYVEQEANYINSKKFSQDKKFWDSKFNTIPNSTSLTSSPPSINLRAQRLSFNFNAELIKDIVAYCSNQKISINTFFLSILNIYVSKVTGEEDITILTSIHNRNNAKDKETLGMYVSTVPFRINYSLNNNFNLFIKNIASEQFRVFRHQKYPYNYLARDFMNNHKSSIQDLCHISFSYQNTKFINQQYPFQTKWYFNGYQETPIIFHINDRENKGKISMDIDYRIDSFNDREIKNIPNHLCSLIKNILKNPGARLSNVEMISEKEKEVINLTFNNTDSPFSRNKTLSDIFEEQVEKNPNKIAVRFKNKSLSYGDLNKRANCLAYVLRSKGIKPDNVVAIVMDRSLEMMVSILGILKAGGAYVPISPDYPQERVSYILQDSQVDMILTQKNHIHNLQWFSGEILTEDEYQTNEGNSENPVPVNKQRDLAYVIYTSGSTGKPKGVMIEHYTVINHFEFMTRKYKFGSKDVILQKTPFIFDASVFELFIWIFSGGSICFLEPGDEKDPYKIGEAIEYYGITSINFVPSMLNIFLEALSDIKLLKKVKTLRRIFPGGEPLQTKHVELFNKTLSQAYGVTLHNLYGPTESTIDSSVFDCPPGKLLTSIPIGRPIQNVKFHIVDSHCNLQPIGVPGELCISGESLARGYINNTDLTKDKFVNNPFNSSKKMYKTGDLARWLPDGNVEYLGRMDLQLKIRGYRIEAGEIESCLLLHQKVKEAVVVGHKEREDSYLVAYIVADPEVEFKSLREHLLKRLPNYMIPSHFILLEHFPLTVSGKLDRKRLPIPDKNNIKFNSTFIPASTPIEKQLSVIWCEVLSIEEVSINTQFYELGGHSLLATQIVSRIKREFNIDMSLQDFFNHTTIKDLSIWINDMATSKNGINRIKKIDRSSRVRN